LHVHVKEPAPLVHAAFVSQPPLLVAHSSTSAQVAAVSVPALHDDGPETVYPEAHVGWQVLPDASVLVQSPAAPLRGAVAALHESAAQVAAVSVPVMHDDGPETVYPAAHTGWQVLPDGSVLVQVPAAPLGGAQNGLVPRWSASLQKT
jgi:hypothetical protein